MVGYIIDVYKMLDLPYSRQRAKTVVWWGDVWKKGSRFPISTYQISREILVNVITCYKCNKLGVHTPSSSNKDDVHNICSQRLIEINL